MADDIRSMLMDDHDIVRTGLHKLPWIKEGIRVVGDYASAVEALGRISS